MSDQTRRSLYSRDLPGDARILEGEDHFHKASGLLQIPLDEQIKELLKTKDFEEAIDLARKGVTEADKTTYDRLAIVYAEAGFLQLFDLRFKEAIDYLLLSNIVEPAELFPFFPSLTARWRALVPRKRYWGLHPPPQSLVSVIQNGLFALQNGLLEPPTNVEHNGKTDNLLVGISSQKTSGDYYFALAVENFIRYWTVVREWDLSLVVKEGVDTILMLLYIETGCSEELQQLATRRNSCLLDEVETVLRSSGQLQALALLYESKNALSAALEVWKNIAEDSPEFSSVTALPSSSDSGTVTMTISPSQLAAASEAARLLEVTSESSVILQHLRWVSKVDLDLGMQILCSTKRRVPLPSEDVLKALQVEGTVIYQRFLQWLVVDQGSQDSRYHTDLALSLGQTALKAIKNKRTVSELKYSRSRNCTSNDSERGEGKHAEAESQGQAAHTDGSQYQNLSILFKTVHSQTDSCLHATEVRNKLQMFLNKSNLYDVEMVLASICETELWQEQAILHKKRGDEASALRILALKLEDSEAAEKYCIELGRPNAFMQLLDMYLKPGEGKDPLYGPAIRLLHSHGASLDPLQVLEALSPNMPLQLACRTLARMLQARVHYHCEGQIVRHLSRAVNLETRLVKIEGKSRHIQITDESLCGSCGARIGTKLFAVYPNGVLACFKCLRRCGEHVCPVTGRNFEASPFT